MKATLNHQWVDFARGVVLLHDPVEMAGIQRIYSHLDWVVPGNIFRGGMTLADIGYTQAKLTQLTNHYYHYVAVQRAVNDLKVRVRDKKYGSGAFDFRGLPKKNTKQDFCMQSGVVSLYPSTRTSEFTIFYRTVELIKRFRGDIVWLDTFILPHFDFVFDAYPLAQVNFRFTNATWHPMFAPMLHQNGDDMSYWERLRREHPDAFKAVCKWMWYYIIDSTQSIDKYSSGRQVRVILEKKLTLATRQALADWFRPHCKG